MSSVKRIKVAHESTEDTSSTIHDSSKHIQDLPTDVFHHCLEFVGKGNFAFVAPVSKQFYWNYINLGVEMKNNILDVDVILQQGRNRQTTAKDVATGSLRLATECFLKAPKDFQEEVCRQAAVIGRLDILKSAVAFGIDMKESVFPYRNADGTENYDISVQLAETVANGHLDVIEFLHKQDIHLDDEDIVFEIGHRGKASILHWMMTKGLISSFWKKKIFKYLVNDGEIDILKESYKHSHYYVNGYTFRSCVESGNVEVINWLLQENECEWDSSLFFMAAISGSIPMMELCLQNRCPMDERICSSAMMNKNKEVALTALKWLREKNVPWDKRVCEYAAIYGNLKALKWARENGCPWDEETFYDAAQFGNIDILDYCFENDCPLDLDERIYCRPFEDEDFNPTFSELQERSLKVYKWLREHSIPWDDEASLAAAEVGHLTTLMWAIKNGCPWHDDIIEEAIGSYNMPMLEYCLEYLSPTDDDIYVLAMNKMNNSNQRETANVTDAQMIKILQKIHDFGVPWSRDIISRAEQVDRSNVANWLRCVGCPE